MAKLCKENYLTSGVIATSRFLRIGFAQVTHPLYTLSTTVAEYGGG